jgi:hypothetical protein
MKFLMLKRIMRLVIAVELVVIVMLEDVKM